MSEVQAMRAGPEIGRPTDPLAILRTDQFPGFLSAARANPDLNVVESRGVASTQFGCGRTHPWAVCGDNDFIAAGGPGCSLGAIHREASYDRQQNLDITVTGVAPAALSFTLDDPNGTGIGALLADWFLGSTANTNTTAPLADSVIEIRTYACTLSIQFWQLTSFVEVTAGQTYQFVIDTTVAYPGPGPCPDIAQAAADMAACIASIGIGTTSTTLHSQDPPQWGVMASLADGPQKCELEHQANVSWRPRLFYALRGCDDWLGEIDFPARVRDDITLNTNAELSRLLEIDDGRAQNPSLISAAQNLTPGSTLGTPGTPVSVTRAFTLLLDAFAQVGSGYGTFHGATLALPWMMYCNQVDLDGLIYRGPMRFPYNPGPGFTNAIPVVAGGQPDGSTIDADDAAWLYGVADSPVEYRVGGVEVDSYTPADSDNGDRTNKSGARAEHKAIVRFNTCSVFAVRVCTTDIENITVPIP